MRYRKSIQVIMTVTVLLWSLLVCPPGNSAQDKSESSIIGQWEGSIKIPGTELGIKIDFTRDSAGNNTGTIDIPMQGAANLPLANVRFDGDSVVFDLPNVPGNPIFKGILSGDSKNISGDFSQDG